MEIAGGQIDIRFEPIRFARDHVFEQLHTVAVTAGGDIDLAEMRHQHQVVRLLLAELLERAGFEVEACYGWFDRTPYRGGEDTVWVARRPDA